MPQLPFSIMRFRGPQTDDDVWPGTFEVLKQYRACCDEVWLSTGIGIPTLESHRKQAANCARAAADLRSAGILPGLQFQATLGHGDSIANNNNEDTSGKHWGGFTGADGTECRYCSCPRQPEFLAYLEEVSRLYAAWHPSSVWIDDDLRLNNHSPVMEPFCYCDRCLDDFAKVEGKRYAREALYSAIKTDSALLDRWEAFQFTSLAEIARTIAAAFHAVSPETMMGYQHCHWPNASLTKIYRALFEASGHPVGSRPGGGAYYDNDPWEQLSKAYFQAYIKNSLRPAADIIAMTCPEIETWPRTFSCRNGQSLAFESLINLAQGCDSLSYFIMAPRFETPEWYGKKLLSRLCAEMPLYKEFVEYNRGAVPCGIRVDTEEQDWYHWKITGERAPHFRVTMGLPLVCGEGMICANLSEIEKALPPDILDLERANTARILQVHQVADKLSAGRMPVKLESAGRVVIMPMADKDGTLRSVTVLNPTIDVMDEVRLRLRGVPENAQTAEWRSLGGAEPVRMPLTRDGRDALLTVPDLAAWNAGWMRFR